MFVRSRLVLAVLLALTPLAIAADNAADLQDHVKKAAEAATPTVAGLKPWHAKLSVQLYDFKGTPTGTGSIEEWWMAPGNEKRVFAFPGYQGTELHQRWHLPLLNLTLSPCSSPPSSTSS